LLEFARTAAEQASRGDAIALICAHGAALAGDSEELVRIDKLVLSRKLSSETRTMTVRMGKKFAELGAQVINSSDLQSWRELVVSGTTPGCYPVALAVNFAAQGLSARDAYVVHQYGVVSTILGAALRLMRVGHIDTQQMLFDLCKDMDASYEIAASSDLEAMAGFAPMAEILASVHLKAHVRLFMS
jgi:urease accessory protein